MTLVNLHPFTAYNCCVAANSSNGIGRLSCLRAVTCKSYHFSSALNHWSKILASIVYWLYVYTVPSGVPTRLMTFAINSTTVLLSWHAPDADEYSNGVLRQYYIESTDNSSSQMSFYLSDDTHLLLGSLQSGHQYTFQVAAYTNEKGLFSEPTSITLPSLQGILASW